MLSNHNHEHLMPTNTRTPTHVVLTALRTCHPDHEELIVLLDGVSARINWGENPLNSKCRAIVIDLLDQASEAVSADLKQQKKEQALDDSKQRRTA